MYKFQKGLLPTVFDNYFSKPSHHHATRFATENNLSVLRIDTALDKSRLRYIGPLMWLKIPMNIKKAPSFEVLILECKEMTS